jgi:hypothetical protein
MGLFDFAIGLYEEFQHTGQLSDLERAVSLFREISLGLPTQLP